MAEMQTYKVKDPTGAIREIRGPAGASDDEVIAQAKRLFGGEVPRETSGNPLIDATSVPKVDAGGKLIREAPASRKQPSLTERAIAFPDAALGALNAPIAALLGQTAGAAQYATEGAAGRPDASPRAKETAGAVSSKLTAFPRTEAGREKLGEFAHFLDETKLAGLNPYQATEVAALAGPATRAAAKGAAESPEAFAARQAASKAGRAVRAVVDPQTAGLVKKAEEMGIRVPPDKLTDNRFLRILGQAARDVPLSGSGTTENRAAFNRAIIRTFGGDPKADKITPQVFGEAMKKHGKVIGDISSSVNITIPDYEEVALKIRNATRNQTPDVKGVIEGYLSDMKKEAGAGNILGETWKNLRGEVTTQMRGEQGNLQRALSQLDDLMLDATSKHLPPEQIARFDEARHFYSNGKTVEPLVAKAAAKGHGDMSPAALSSQVVSTGGRKTAVAQGKGGDLADIAAVGSRFLTEPSTSMTAERGVVYGGLGGAYAINPLLAGGLYGAASLYNRLGPEFTRMLMSAKP